MAMFQQPVRQAGNVHVEFKAGRLDWDGKLVTPQKTKGKVVLITTEEDGLMHLQWHDRDKNEIVVDLIVINDCYMEKIEKCTTGEVYILRFTSSDKKFFFWMQEPKAEGNPDLIKKFNDEVGADIPAKGASGAAASAAAPAAAAGAAAPAAAAGAAATGGDPNLRAALQQFLNNPQAAQAAAGTPPIPLGAVLTSDVLTGLLADEAAVTEMMTHLPETHRTPEGLREALTSAQLQQSMNSLTQAIHSDQLPVLLSGLGLNSSAVYSAQPGTDALEVLCRAMENQNGNGGASGGAAPTSGSGN